MAAIAQDASAGVAIPHSGHQKIARIKSYLTNIFKLDTESESEIHLLKQFIFLPNEWLSFAFLETLLQRKKLEWQETFPAVLEGLWERGLLQKDESRDSYKMHPVLVEALEPQMALAWDDIALLCESVTELLELDQATENPVDKFQYVLFGDALLRQAGEDFFAEFSTLKNNLAIIVMLLGEYEKARDLLETALKSDLENFGEKHPTVAVSQSNLANVYRELGEYEKARDLWQRAYRILLNKFGEDHPHTQIVKRFLDQ